MGERALVASVFGDAVDCDSARVSGRKWWPLQPNGYAMAPRGCIHFHPRDPAYRDDFAAAPLGLQGLFLHEMTHVWQHQAGINLLLRRHPFCRYSYAVMPGRPFARYGLEQQAELVRHAFLLRHGRAVPGAPPLAVYDGILPFAASEG